MTEKRSLLYTKMFGILSEVKLASYFS